MINKGDVYLADLGKKSENDIGKIRPVCIFQNRMLNRAVNSGHYTEVIIIPLSTRLAGGDYRLRIPKRDKLEYDSELFCNGLRMIDASRLYLDRGVITRLSGDEIMQVERILYDLFECNSIVGK